MTYDPPGFLPWMDAANCTEIAPDAWFPEKGAVSNLTYQAVEVCKTCPVRQRCLDYAIDNEIRFGTWGGKTAEQRARMKNPSRGAA
jgi:WhiB family redox-sensing transcriptional regulator